MYPQRRSAIRTVKGLVWPSALTALEIDWNEDDPMKTTVNGISDITFIELNGNTRVELNC